MKPTLKDLRTTYRVLTHLDEAVPQQLIIGLADRIKADERLRLLQRLDEALQLNWEILLI